MNISGPNPFNHISVSATPSLTDDVLVGFIVGNLLMILYNGDVAILLLLLYCRCFTGTRAH